MQLKLYLMWILDQFHIFNEGYTLDQHEMMDLLYKNILSETDDD